jgi:hypothetical protein
LHGAHRFSTTCRAAPVAKKSEWMELDATVGDRWISVAPSASIASLCRRESGISRSSHIRFCNHWACAARYRICLNWSQWWSNGNIRLLHPDSVSPPTYCMK